MKKLYKKPEFRVVEIKNRVQLLAGSETPNRWVIDDEEQDNDVAY